MMVGSISSRAMTAHLRLAKNTAALVFLRVVKPVFSVAVVLVASRLLGSQGLGRYTLAFTFLYFFGEVAPLGLYALITREGARDRTRLERLLANAIPLGLCAAIVLSLSMVALVLALNYDGPTQTAVILLSPALIPATLNSFFEATFVALERMEYIALSAIAENLFKVCIAVGLLLCGYGLNAALLAAVGGYVLACIVSVSLIRRAGVRVRVAWDHDMLRELGTAAPTFLLISVFATLYWRIDIFMLSKLRSVADVGLYSAAWRLLEFAIIAPQSLCLALYPQMASARNDVPSLAGLGETAARYLFAVSLPLATALTVLGGSALAFLYGESFRAATATLSVLIWTVVPYCWVRYHAYILVAADRQRIDLSLNVLITGLNVVLNLFLIPAYGHFGAAVATLISVGVYSICQYAYLRWYLPGHVAPLTLHPAPLLAAVTMGACAWLLRGQAVVAALGVSAAVYVGVLFVGQFFTAEELKLLHLDRLFGNARLLRARWWNVRSLG